MKKRIETLIQLQAIDTRLDDLKLQKGDLPNLIEQIEQELEEVATQIEEINQKLSHLNENRRMFEKEIEASKKMLEKFEGQLYQVKTNREYDAISSEIETKKSQIGNLENKILQTYDEETELKKQLEELSEKKQQMEKQFKEYKKELDEISQSTKAEEEKLLAEREALTKMMDKSWLQRYERIRKAKGGIAVAPIERNSCGGCFSAIPPQRIVEIRESNRIYTCDFCGRILVWTGD